MLSREGFEMVSAVGFSAAIEACKQGQFDLVIMGHSIPSADKTAIITQLRAMCDTPVLALRRPNEAPLNPRNTTSIRAPSVIPQLHQGNYQP